MARRQYQYAFNFLNIPYLNYRAEDKDRNADYMVRYMLARTSRMFKYGNLPETITRRAIELFTQTNGYGGWADYKDNLYYFFGGLGGKPDHEYMPTTFIVANPALEMSKTYEINKNCIIMPNDTLYQGLMPMLSKYCSMLAENELTMNVVDIMARSALVFKADDERERTSAQQYIADLKDGKLSVITSDKLIGSDGVDAQPGATDSAAVMTHLIEMEQYFKAAMFNELGLNANWNAKRETITSSETLLNSDTLLPLIDDMLYNRQEAIEKVNKMFGTNITVEFDSAWEDNETELELTEEMMKNQAENAGQTNELEGQESLGQKEQEVKDDGTEG